jgi:hypothetical protein
MQFLSDEEMAVAPRARPQSVPLTSPSQTKPSRVSLSRWIPRAFPAGLSPQRATHAAMAVLYEVLLAPLPLQQRHAILSEICAAWRLQLTPAPAAITSSDTPATAPRRPDFDAVISPLHAVARIAQRCARVYLAGRRYGIDES